MNKPVLLIACGNPLRSDDGMAQEVLRRLEYPRDPLLDFAHVEEAHQLTPEMAESAAHARRVIIVDARCGGEPGLVEITKVKPPQQISSSGLTHDFGPEALLHTSRHLYGASPELFVISVSGSNFDHGEFLSPLVSAAIPVAVSQVRQLIKPMGAEETTQDA